MRIGERKNVAPSEEKLLKITGLIGNALYGVRRVFSPGKILNAEQLCDIAKIDTATLDGKGRELLGKKVSQVCRAGSRFTKDSICVQFEEDGNDVMRWAYKHGALLLITREQIDNLPCIVCDDPEIIYSRMCRHFRDNSKADFVAIVGSIGKTTAKRMVGSVLKEQFNTFCDPENENQLDCVGNIAQHIPKGTKMIVQEVSEDYSGSVRNISNLIAPKIAVITSVDKSHIEQYGSEERIAEEICSITSGMGDDGIVIINIDDENTANLSINKRVVAVSANGSNADFVAEDIEIKENGLEFDIVVRNDGSRHKIKLKYTYARHNVISALYAFAVGTEAGVSYKNIVKGLCKYRTAGIRQNIYVADGKYVYADCYNAVARSVRSAIEGANLIPVEGNRFAVLGDVEEAGEFSEQTHLEIIDAASKAEFKKVYLYGDKLHSAMNTFCDSFDRNVEFVCAKTKRDIVSRLRKDLNKGDLVLFKASRKSALEDVIKGVFPRAYRKQKISYYLPIIVWRLKVTFN